MASQSLLSEPVSMGDLSYSRCIGDSSSTCASSSSLQLDSPQFDMPLSPAPSHMDLITFSQSLSNGSVPSDSQPGSAGSSSASSSNSQMFVPFSLYSTIADPLEQNCFSFSDSFSSMPSSRMQPSFDSLNFPISMNQDSSSKDDSLLGFQMTNGNEILNDPKEKKCMLNGGSLIKMNGECNETKSPEIKLEQDIIPSPTAQYDLQKEKKPDLPPPPKKPLSPYMRFSKAVWQQVKSLNPNRSVCEVGAAIGRIWRELLDVDKQKYIDEFTTDKIRYDGEMLEYLHKNGLQPCDLIKPRTKKTKEIKDKSHSSPRQNKMSAQQLSALQEGQALGQGQQIGQNMGHSPQIDRGQLEGQDQLLGNIGNQQLMNNTGTLSQSQQLFNQQQLGILRQLKQTNQLGQSQLLQSNQLLQGQLQQLQTQQLLGPSLQQLPISSAFNGVSSNNSLNGQISAASLVASTAGSLAGVPLNLLPSFTQVWTNPNMTAEQQRNLLAQMSADNSHSTLNGVNEVLNGEKSVSPAVSSQSVHVNNASPQIKLESSPALPNSLTTPALSSKTSVWQQMMMSCDEMLSSIPDSIKNGVPSLPSSPANDPFCSNKLESQHSEFDELLNECEDKSLEDGDRLDFESALQSLNFDLDGQFGSMNELPLPSVSQESLAIEMYKKSVDHEKMLLRNHLVEKSEEILKLMRELEQAYSLIHQLKQQNDYFHQQWTVQQQLLKEHQLISQQLLASQQLQASQQLLASQQLPASQQLQMAQQLPTSQQLQTAQQLSISQQLQTSQQLQAAQQLLTAKQLQTSQQLQMTQLPTSQQLQTAQQLQTPQMFQQLQTSQQNSLLQQHRDQSPLNPQQSAFTMSTSLPQMSQRPLCNQKLKSDLVSPKNGAIVSSCSST